MKELIVNKRFIITFLAFMMSSFVFGQSENSRNRSVLSGKGTEYSPYII